MWIVVIGLLAVGALALLIRAGGGPMIQRERERLILQQRRQQEREAAKKVLAGEVQSLPAVPEVALPAGEEAFFAAQGSLLQPVGEDHAEYERVSRGLIVITGKAFIYRPEKGATVRLEADNIGRVDIPLADILQIVTFADTFTRDEQIYFYQLDQPLLAAAHISRFADFQLVL